MPYVEAGTWEADRMKFVFVDGKEWDLAKYPILAFQTSDTTPDQPGFVNYVRIGDDGTVMLDPETQEPLTFTKFGTVVAVWFEREFSHGFYFRAILITIREGDPFLDEPYLIPKLWVDPPELTFWEQTFWDNNKLVGKEFEIECCEVTTGLQLCLVTDEGLIPTDVPLTRTVFLPFLLEGVYSRFSNTYFG